MTRFGSCEQFLEPGPVGEVDRSAGRVNGELLQKIAGQLALVTEQAGLQLPNVLEPFAVRQFTARIHARPKTEVEPVPVVADALDRVTLPNRPVAIAPRAHDIKAFKREPGRINLLVA